MLDKIEERIWDGWAWTSSMRCNRQLLVQTEQPAVAVEVHGPKLGSKDRDFTKQNVGMLVIGLHASR
jgi:hypothetical protein